jgi:hypothetical protein
MELTSSANAAGSAQPVTLETVNLCGFEVPLFRGAQPIPEDVISQLKQPLPKDAVRPNSDPRKQGMSSIRSIFIVERLNEVFGLGQWFQATKFVEKVAKAEGSGKGDSIVLKSILVVPKYGIYFEAFGGNDNYDPGDAYKGASTDALTKMAGFLYVGMDVFKGHPETSNQPQAAAQSRKAAPAPAPVAPPNLATMPAHSDQAPPKASGRLINATEKRAFWTAVKQGRKTEAQVLEYFGKLGIENTNAMKHADFDPSMKWAVTL